MVAWFILVWRAVTPYIQYISVQLMLYGFILLYSQISIGYRLSVSADKLSADIDKR